MNQKISFKWVLGLTFFALLIRTFLALNTYVIGTDSFKFLTMANYISQGQFAEAFRMLYHPFYPLLIFYMNLGVGNFEAAAVLVSLLFSSLTVIPLFYLVQRLWNPPTAWLASFFYIVHPVLVDVQSDIMTEGVFIFFFVSAITLGWKALEEGRWSLYLLAGVCAALGYLTRVEGILISLLFTFWAIIFFVRGISCKKNAIPIIRGLLLFWAILLLCTFPYLLWIHQESGQWGFSVKPSAKMALQTRKDAPEEDVYNPPKQTHIKRQDQYTHKLGRFVGSLLFSSEMWLKALHWALLPFLLMGIFSSFKQHPSLICASYVLTFILCHAGGIVYGGYKLVDLSYRYFLPPSVLLLPWVAIGFRESTRWLVGKFYSSESTRTRVNQTIFILAFLSLSLPSLLPRRYEFIGFKEAGQWIRSKGHTNPPIMTTREATAYYAAGQPLPVPFTYSDTQRTALEKNVHYLVLSDQTLGKLESGFLDYINKSPFFRREQIFPEIMKGNIHTVYVFSVVRNR